jgi:hypothetical protein
MCVSTDSNLLSILDVNFYHGRLFPHNVHDSQDDLEDVFPSKLLAILEALDHILDKLQRHGIPQRRAVI